MSFMIYKTPVLSGYANNFVTPLKEVYDLGTKVSKKKITTNEANLESLDIMLKYNVVGKTTVERLVKMHKLDDIKGIENIIEKY